MYMDLSFLSRVFHFHGIRILHQKQCSAGLILSQVIRILVLSDGTRRERTWLLR